MKLTNFIVTHNTEHYNNHVLVHKADAEYLNKPIENYAEMETIFGNSMATDKFAKDSSAALGTEDGETEEVNANGTEDGPSTPLHQGVTLNGSKPKKAKIVENIEEWLIGAFDRADDKLSIAIKEVAKSNLELPEDLFAQVKSLSVSGFNDYQISMYYAHLVSNPVAAKAFYRFPFENKLHWMAIFINEKFPEQ